MYHCMHTHTHTAPLLAADSPVAIKGEYIVIFKTELEDNEGIYCTCTDNDSMYVNSSCSP